MFVSFRPHRLRLISLFSLSLLFLLLLSVGRLVSAQSICDNCQYNTTSPEARPGGPYVGMTGQNVQLDGWDSWSSEGWIMAYYWDFGDGTGGSGPNPSHQYSADGVYTVWLTVCDENWTCAWSQSFVTVDSVNLPVRLNFEDIGYPSVVANQYYSQYGVKFYSAKSLLSSPHLPKLRILLYNLPAEFHKHKTRRWRANNS